MLELGVGLAIAAALIAAGTLLWPLLPAGKRPSKLTADGSEAARSDGFIGREAELKLFRELLQRETYPWLAVIGANGMGKRSLLQRFKRECDRLSPPLPCGPVVDLGEPRALHDRLEEIVDEIQRQRPDAFANFTGTLQRYRSVAAGQRSPGERMLAASKDAAAGLLGSVPVPGASVVGQALTTPAANEIMALGYESIAGRGDLASVTETFLAELEHLVTSPSPEGSPGGSPSGARLVLAFDDLDSAADSEERRWLSQKLFPALAHLHVIVVAAGEDPHGLDEMPHGDRELIKMPLQPFTPVETLCYAHDVIGIAKDNDRLATAIVDRSEGSPQKLAIYKAYYENHPEARQLATLPPEADALATGGEVSALLQEVRSDFLRRVIVISSPLRWFNETLLAKVADEAKLTPADDEQGLPASALLRRERRPSWITPVRGGWGIAREEWRRAFAEEFRRLNPTLYSQVHMLAAHYHRRQLLEMEERPPTEAAEGTVFDYTPNWKAIRPLESADYTAALAEWLRHTLALAPRRRSRQR